MRVKIDNNEFDVSTVDELIVVVNNYNIVADVKSVPPHLYGIIQQRINETNMASKKTIRKVILKNIWTNVSKFSLDYWIDKGHSKEYAITQVANIQSTNSKKRYSKYDKNSVEYKKQFNTTLEYWMGRGYDVESAKEKLKERQITFSLDKCIDRYGPDVGLTVFNKRQEKWINTLSNKTDDETKEIRSKQLIGFGIASKESIEVFSTSIMWLDGNNIEYYIGIDGNKEYFLYNKEVKKLFWYDLTIPSLNTIIEYNGIKWHPREDVEWEGVFGIDEDNKLNEDIIKLNTAKSAGFDVLVIWSDEDTQSASEKCLTFLKEKYEKT
jgi:hypothetical protein